MVDGTWRQAHRIMREDCLQRAVREGSVTLVRFADIANSSYKFRLEPRSQCVSSLEAVAYSLSFLERSPLGEQAASVLLAAFDLMVAR